MKTIATIYTLQQYLNLDGSTDTARLQTALKTATATIERLTGRYFTPYQATRTQSIQLTDRTHLFLDDDLLSISAMTDDRGATIDLANILLLPDDDSPVSIIQALNGITFNYSKVPENAIAVTGVWGWHDAPAQMWRDSGDVVGDNPLSATATTITITDSALADSAGESPRFQVGHLLQIEDELMRVISVNPASLGVIRGVNGSVSMVHAQATPIYTYQPPADVNGLCLRLAAWYYREPDQRGSGDIPPALTQAITRLRRLRVSS